MERKIALIGNPNSGKTTLFNALTGSSQHVGNWPGVTVERKEGRLKGHKDVAVIDLPGVYSLSPYSPEEDISRRYLIEGRPDVVINVADSTNLERSLFLTLQVLETGAPTVLALNMSDVAEKKGQTIDVERLSKNLSCPVVKISALKKIGLEDLIKASLKSATEGKRNIRKRLYGGRIEDALSEISAAISENIDTELRYWHSVKILERDEYALGKLSNSVREKALSIVDEVERKEDDDGESLIASGRYAQITDILKDVQKKAPSGDMTLSEKVDNIVTNRWLAIPIFVGVIFAVYFVSITTLGGILTDWVNTSVMEETVLPGLSGWLTEIGVEGWLVSLTVDGIAAGVGAVIGFLPQLMVLFLLLAILEDCGYMARVAFVMDRILRRFGLSGKSFIPIIVGTGCGVPGIMASRTIEDERDRKITVMTTTFMPCSAKLPVIALIAGALFGGSFWIAPAMYFLGITAILVSGVILKKMKGVVGKPAPFVMELPDYHMPGARTVSMSVGSRTWHFVKKAGTIIVVASAAVWFLSSYSWNLTSAGVSDSMLASIGGFIAPIFEPLGWSDWRAVVGTITGLIAKENLISTFGVIFGLEEVSEAGEEVWSMLAAIMTPLAGLSFLAFNMLCAPCFAAIGAMRRELGSWRETAFAVAFQCAFAYVVAMTIYHVGGLIAYGTFSVWTLPTMMVLALIVYLFVRDPERGPLFGSRGADA